MSENADDVERLRQLRSVWGWIFVALWIGFWWWSLNEQKLAALARPCPESLTNAFGDFFIGKGQTCRANIEGNFAWGIFFFVICSPFMFLIANTFAKWRLQAIKTGEHHAELAEERSRLAIHEARLGELNRRTQNAQVDARAASDRYEIITRLGAVDDQLVVLDNESGAENIKLIKLNIGQSIRDIHAKFKDDELRELYRSDEGLRKRVDRTLTEMRRLELQTSRFYADLAEMFHDPSPK